MLTLDQRSHLYIGTSGRLPPPYRLYADGTAVWIYLLLHGQGRLCIGHQSHDFEEQMGFDRGFCYENVQEAFAAADAWDGHGEPDGWFRCLQTGRRRPSGDPAKEYVLP